MGRVEEIIEMMPRSIAQEPAAQRFLHGIFAGTAQIEAYHNLKIAGLKDLDDPSVIPDELVRHLAALVGIGDEYPPANNLSVEQRRALIPVAVALWKKKGTRTSWRDVALFLEGARSLILDWFELRIIAGSSFELLLIPSPGTAPGGAYDFPEYVTDMWVMDTNGSGLDFDLLAQWLGEMLPSSERINLYEAMFIEDLRVGTSQWTIEDLAAVPPDGMRLDLSGTMGDGSAGGILSTAGNTIMMSDEIPFAPSSTAGQHVFAKLAIQGEGEVILFSGDDLGDDSYTAVITNDAGAGFAECEVFRLTAGTPASLAVFVLPQILVDRYPYRWRFRVDRIATVDTEITVQWEGVLLGTAADLGSALTDGRFGFRAGPAASDRAIVQTVLIWRPPPTRVRVGLDP